ncbi:unnamed protein product [Thelazia callipaeda]|uniref:non-specific serine/threonine protein kinase n=1 Tax=Thelazia callipaeda TaxID=103827 RepID=A0A0N5D1K7_THECL|nr:unnamed protein product [Thelazia callipaeda]
MKKQQKCSDVIANDKGILEAESKKRQEDEFIVLRSIFAEDLIDAAKNVWKLQIWQPLNVILHLKPVDSASVTHDKIYVSVDLHVKCPRTYPLSGIPDIELENVRGISLKDVEKLKQILLNKASSLKGNEIILELCQLVQEFLYEHNKPPEGSFFDGMLQQQAAVESERKRQRMKSEQQDREDVVAFQRMREEKLMWKEAEECEPTTPVDDKFCATFSCLDGMQRSLARIACKFQKRPLNNLCCREWSAMDCTTNQELLISEWTFVATTKTKTSSLKAFINHFKLLEKELKKISQLSVSEPTLCKYELLCIQKRKLTASEIDVRIFIGQNITESDRNISSQFDMFETDKALLVRLALQLLKGLEFLHEINLGHFDLDSTSIWITGKRNFVISDYYLRSLLIGQYRKLKECIGDDVPNILSSHVFQKSLIDDIKAVGSIFNRLRMLSSVTKSSYFSKSLDSFVENCKNSQTIKSLMDHRFLHQGLHYLFKFLIDLLRSLLPPINFKSAGFQQVAHGRLRNEFVFMEMLGKGGFGDVMLAKNKLDGNNYAIKRICLDPKDERFSRKVTREAKLFSKLSHPNVVRYYSAWIEQACVTSSKDEPENSAKGMADPGKESGDSLMPLQTKNIEKEAKRYVMDTTAEWSTSFQPASTYNSESFSEKQYTGPIQTLFSNIFPATDQSSDFEVVFGSDEDNDDLVDEHDGNSYSSTSPSNTLDAAPELPLRILFIQMEYCEKSTLRNLIDSNKLLKNSRQVWRLFREILLGLQYIHQEGMIHRDIKPMNILIDGNDHAKIGDFGLATRDVLAKNMAPLSEPDISSSMTKDIGTAFYIAPELLSTCNDDVEYTTKIDVYSLGIVLFEMFYRPLLPGMERIVTIRNLRNSGLFPLDFGSGILEVHQKASKKIIKWMLEMQPDDRPSIQNLLESDRVPVAEIEDDDFQKMFYRAIRTGGRLHHWMMEKLVANPVPPAADYLYDRNICSSDRLTLPRLFALEYTSNKLCGICSTHAFIPFDVHSLTPFSAKRSDEMKNSKSRACRFIDENGITIMLAHDLRRNFARYCVRNGVNRLKRYSYGKVFGRSDALGGIHPAERVEFAIDAVGPVSSSRMLTTDILCVMVEIARQLDCLSSRKWEIRLGHRDLILATALYLGFSDFGAQNKILDILYAIAMSNKVLTREQKIERLRVGTEMSFYQAKSLFSVLEGDLTLESLTKKIECLLNSRDDRVRKYAEGALKEFGDLTLLLECFAGDITGHILFDGSLCYRPQTYSSGLVFQFRVLFFHKKTMRPVVVGAGGRYDNLLEEERHAQDPIPPKPLSAVGCSLSLDVLAQLCCTDTPSNFLLPRNFEPLCHRALVCLTADRLLKATGNLVKQMWLRRIQTDVLHDPVVPMQMVELIEHSNENNIEVLLVVYGEDEVLTRVGGVDLGKLTFDEVLCKLETLSIDSCLIETCSSTQISTSPIKQIVNVSPAAAVANLSIRYAVTDKPVAYIRKRNEVQIRTCLQKAVAAFSPQTVIEVVVTDISSDAIRLLVSLIDRTFTVVELSNALSIAMKQMNRFKKEFKRIEEVIEPLFQPRNSSPIVLYSKQDSNSYYRFLL